MPLFQKRAGALVELRRGDVFLRDAVAAKRVEQIWVKDSSGWKPVFPVLQLARWGYATFAGESLAEYEHQGPQAFIDGLTSLMASNDNGETLTYSLPDGNTFAYFAHPKVLGVATFTDLGNGFAGAWDGATWKEDLSNFEAMGPVEVTYDPGTGPEQWYVYRTDWQGPSYQPTTFRVDYPDRPEGV